MRSKIAWNRSGSARYLARRSAPAGMALGIPAVTTEEHGDVAVDAAELLEEELALIGQLRRGRRALVGPVLRGPVLPLARVGALFEKRIVANGRGLGKVPGQNNVEAGHGGLVAVLFVQDAVDTVQHLAGEGSAQHAHLVQDGQSSKVDRIL